MLLGQASVTDKGAERALGEFAVVGNSEATPRGMAQDDVATGLVVGFLADLTEGFDGVRTGTNREAAHTGTSMISSVMGLGTGSPCFSRLWR